MNRREERRQHAMEKRQRLREAKDLATRAGVAATPQMRAKRMLGVAWMLVAAAVAIGIPSYLLAGFIAQLAGWQQGPLSALLGTLLWLLVLAAVVWLLFHFHWNHNRGDDMHHPRNTYDEILEALEKIGTGDFDVLLQEADNRHYHGQIADRINHVARQLASMEGMREDFVANVSHEIQSPITSIAGFAKLLEKPGLDDKTKRHYLGVIQNECSRLSKLSDNLLRLSTLESGAQLQKSSYRLDKQLAEVLLILEPHWREKGVEVELEAVSATLEGDAALLEQVWINLVHNAVKFTPAGGSVTVALMAEGEGWRCVVKDTGKGMDETERMHAFERFYKADASRGQATGGSGLGLPLAKRIVEMHGGRITLDSAPGKGSSFTVTLAQ